MGRRLKTEHFTADAVVDANRVSDVLAVSFKPNVQGFPARCKFAFPGELALTAFYVHFTFVAAACNQRAPYFKTFTFVGDLVSFGVKLVGAGGVEVPAFFADSKIGQNLSVGFLSDFFLNDFADFFGVDKYSSNFIEKYAFFVDFLG